MNGSLNIPFHDVNCGVSDGLSRLHQRAAGDHHSEHGHQFAASSNAVEDADAPASCIFDLSNLVDEKFRHAKRIESIRASHRCHSSSLSNEEHSIIYVRFPTNYFAT